MFGIGAALRARISSTYELFRNDSLFRNATYLMASTAIMSVLGFVFWVFVAHLYSPTDIGTASTLISITALISNLSLLGLNSGIVRFLSQSKKPSQDINAAALTVAGVTIFAAIIYILFGTHAGGNLTILNDAWHKIAFIVLMVSVSLNSLTDAVFISNRRGEYHTIGYATFGVVKLLLPLVLIPFGASGIFGSYILAMVASLGISIYLMYRGCGYHLLTLPDWTLVKRIRGYTFHNYLGVVLSGLPAQLMPLLIIRSLGAASVAFFSMAWTMANLLYIIPSAVTQSLLAESSYDSRKQTEHLKRTIRLLVLLLTPAVALSIAVSPYLLGIFGPQYRANGTQLFQILAFMTFFMAISSVGNTMLNIERRTWGIVAVQLTTLLATSFSALALVRFGLIGVGLAFLIGNVAASLTHLWLRLKRQKVSGGIVFPREPEQLQQLLKPYGIDKSSARVLGNGSRNCTLLVTTASQQYILRIYQPDFYSDEQIKQEIDFMQYLSEQGLPTPHVLPNKAGQMLSHQTLIGVNWQYLVMEFVAGQHPTDYTTTLLNNMALLQAQLHLNGIAYAATRGHSQRKRPRTRHFSDQLLKRLADQGFSHFDYDASNLLVDDEQINGILDFEGMRYGPLVACVYFTLTRIYDYHQDPTMLTSYLASYQQLRRLRPIEKLILGTSLAVRYRKPSFMRTMFASHN